MNILVEETEESIKIFFNEILHFKISKDVISVRSLIKGYSEIDVIERPYVIEYITSGGVKHRTDYHDKNVWELILRGLNNIIK